MPTKKNLRKKAKKICLMVQIVIESHSVILTEPFKSRARMSPKRRKGRV